MRPWTRRATCLRLAAASLAPSLAGLAEAADRMAAGAERIAGVEGRLGGRVGVAVLGPTPILAYRAGERFPMCSTFKVLAAGAILARIAAGSESLTRPIAFGPQDILSYAPATAAALKAAGGGSARLTLDALCAAAVTVSDNSAANLLLRTLGGPEGLTAWLRGLGDPVTRLDRTEPELNTALPGDPRDTTTPDAMTRTLEACLLGTVLSAGGRARLEGWMAASRTGTKRLRAGIPADWGVGDKTGTGSNGTANVVAILRPSGRPPIVATVFMTGSEASAEARDAGHAEIGRILAETL